MCVADLPVEEVYVWDHTVFGQLVGELRDEFTTFAMDRRGFGASQDGRDYSADREYGDVAAVVDAVAARAGKPVVLIGASFGASCALNAARELRSLRALVLYEPSLGLRYPPGSVRRMEERIAAGDQEGAIVEMAKEIAGLTEDQIAERRAAPNWSQRVATARRPSGRLASQRTGTGRPNASTASPSPPCSSPDPSLRLSFPRSHP